MCDKAAGDFDFRLRKSNGIQTELHLFIFAEGMQTEKLRGLKVNKKLFI